MSNPDGASRRFDTPKLHAEVHGHPALRGQPIYLDYNATTPIDERVNQAAAPFIVGWFGNPSSGHAYGNEPRRAVEEARGQVAALVGATRSEIVFCGSGSEADELAIRGALLGGASHGQPLHVVTQPTEHPAVLATCHAMRRWHGAHVSLLDVDVDGLVDPAALDDLLSSPPVDGAFTVVSIMLANNETGTIQPVAQLAEIAHRHGALLHCDAAQAAGKVGVRADDLGADLLTIVGHKVYAPKGIAALCVRDGVALEPLIYGGGQESGRRSGTEPVAAIVALGAAAEVAGDALAAGESDRVRMLRDRFHTRLSTQLDGRVELNGSLLERLPNTLNVSIVGVSGTRLLAESPAIAASTGSACHSGSEEPSPVLSAMGVPHDRALGAIRLSLGRWTTAADVDRAADVLAETAQRLASTHLDRSAGGDRDH